MSRFTYFVALFLAILAVVSGAATRRGSVIPNAGGVAIAGDASVAFVSTTSTTSSSVYTVSLPVSSSSRTAVFFQSTISMQIYYLAASASVSPQMVWVLDNQNAQLKSLTYTPNAFYNTTTLVYDFGIANLDLIDGLYYQASTNLLFFSFYDHFGGATYDYIGYLNPYSANPSVTTIYTTNLQASLAGIAINSQYLYYASVTSAMGGSIAAIYRVPLATGGLNPTTVRGVNATAIYTTTNSDLTSAMAGDIIYPSAMQFSPDGSVLYMTDIGDQSVQAPSTPHCVYALTDIFYFTPANPLNLSIVYQYIGLQTEVQQSFALAPDSSFLYFAATGSQNGLYYVNTPNSTFVDTLPGPALGLSAAPTAGGAAAVSSSAAAVSSSARAVSSSASPSSSPSVSSSPRVSSSASPSSSPSVSSSPAAVSSSAAAVSSSPAAVSSSAAAVSSSAAAVSSSAARVSSSAVGSSSAPAVSSSAAAVSSSAIAATSAGTPPISVPIPAGTITAGPTASFSDNNDALSCLTSNANATVGFAASNGGDIYIFSLTTVPSTLTYSFVAGTGSSGSSFLACQSNPTGTFLYLLDTRQSLFLRYNPLTPTVAPVTISSFPDEVIGSLTALTIDFTLNRAYIGTRQSTLLYVVSITTLGQTQSALDNGNPLTSDCLTLFLSADRTLLYYGFPAPAQGSAGGIRALTVANVNNGNTGAYTTILSNVNIIYPDSIYVNGTGLGQTLYFKDGGAYHAQAGPTQTSTQTISSINLVGTRVLTTIYSVQNINLPSGLIPAPASPFYQLAYTTPTNVNFITVVNTTAAATGGVAVSSSAAGVSSSAAAAVSSSAAAVSSSAARVSSSAAAVSSSAASVSSSPAAVSSSAAPVSSSAAAVSSSAAPAVSSSAARVSSSAVGSSSAPAVSSSAAAVSSSAAAVSSSAAAVSSSAARVSSSAAGSSSAAAVSSSAAAVSSSAAAVSSSAARASSSSAVSVSSTSGTRVVGDPMFVGFLRQRFQVHGMDGVVYNILSQASVSINALFVFLESGNCPIVDGEALTNCWSHPGSYFGSLALQTAAGDKLEIVSGAATSGFGAIRFDGEDVKVTKGVEGTGAKLSFTVLSSHSVAVTIDNYRLVVENSDMFVNLVSIEVLDWQQLASVDQPHGLLGQTWKPPRKARAGQVVAVKDVAEGDVDDYVITSDTLFGTEFVYNKFAKSQ